MHVFLAEGVSTFEFYEIEGITPTSLARGGLSPNRPSSTTSTK